MADPYRQKLVERNKNSSLPPPPFMVFSSKLKVCKCHSNESSDNEKNDEDYKENAVYGVNSMAPHTGKYVVKFDINSTER